ncbi:TPA: radical SAM protein [Candidatus Bathyarchaeota archaeon]|nr:radical SAM protein [Candidatus Bathyarchaeota archaeon]
MVKAYRPYPKFPAISITGRWCALNCKYCYGRYLREMYQATTPAELYALCKHLRGRGALGCLISGGFNRNGKLPIDAFLGTIRDIKRRLGLIVSVHVGLADSEYAANLGRAGVDIVDVNVVTDQKTLEDVLNLRRTTSDMERTLECLYEHGPPYIAPHVLVGACYGRIRGEAASLLTIGEYDPYVLIIISLMPTEGTPMERVPPPPVRDVVSVFKEARRRLPKTELALGCMRQRGPYSDRLERSLLNQGLVDRIVLPGTGCGGHLLNACCSLPSELESLVT